MKIEDIKFRAWDPLLKKMIYSRGLSQVLYGGAGDDIGLGLSLDASIKNWDRFSYGQRSFADCVYMQYTGCKDAKGKEIFEDDLILLDNEHPHLKNPTLHVIFKDGCFTYENTPFDYDGIFPSNAMNISVVGNIHEGIK